MTSSVDELSEENGYPDNQNADEQQKNSESQIHSPSPAIGISNLSIATTNMQYMTPSEVVAGKAMEQMAYPYSDPYYRSIFATHDVQPYPAQPYPTMPFPAQPMVHLQLMGIQQAGVPLPSDAVEEPVFVNAKQYHGILRRRQIRAKAESKKKIVKPQKPYLHESRHLHALRRERGSGGRFLKSKKNEDKQKDGDQTQANINRESNQNQIAPSEGAAH